MHNFNQNRTQKNRPSFDGMIAPQGYRNPGGNGIQRPQIQSGAQPRRGSLDNFRASNGFRPSQQPTLNSGVIYDATRPPQRGPSGNIDLTLTPAPSKPKPRRNRRKTVKRSMAGALAAIILLGGFLFGKGYLKLHQIFKGGAQGAAALQDNPDPSKLRGEGDGRVNILLLGKGGDGHEAPDLTDTILIASIDPVQKQAALLSIPRDLWVQPQGSGYTKINAVYANAKYAAQSKKMSDKDAEKAGMDAIEKEIQSDIGIPIHYYVMIDFKAFEQAINTVGGIDINVAASETVYEVLYDHSRSKNYALNVKEGQQHFDGQRALFYARSRQTSARGDFSRTERQRKIMLALKEKVLSLGTFANPVKISQLTDAFGNHVQANMNVEEVMRFYELGKSIPASSVASVGLADEPNNFVTTDNINGISIVRPRAGIDDFSEIQSYVRNALKDGFIANENATIAVYNGTNTPGLATKKAAELKSYGYTISTVADAPTKNYTSSVLVDLRGGQKKYTKHYLEQRLGITAVTAMPDQTINTGSADFVIILGP